MADQWKDKDTLQKVQRPEGAQKTMERTAVWWRKQPIKSDAVKVKNRFAMLEAADEDDMEDEATTIAAISEVGGLEDIMGVDKDEDWDDENMVNEMVEVTVDSGAARSVWPMRKSGVRRSKLAKKVKLAAANGSDIMVKGEAELAFEQQGRQCSMKFLDADVKRPLASVSAIVDQGNVVVFGPDDAYIENVATKQRVKMKRRRGVFVLELNATEKSRTNAGKMEVEAVEDDGKDEQGANNVEKLENGMWFRSRLEPSEMAVFRRQA